MDSYGTKYMIGEGEFSIQHLYKMGYSAMNNPHAHAYYEIYYCMKGERVYFINGQVYKVQKGDMVFIHPNDLHRTASSDVPECERILINFTEQFIMHELSRCPVRLLTCGKPSPVVRFGAARQEIVEQLLYRMIQECEGREEGYEFCIRTLLAQLLIQLYRTDAQAEAAFRKHVHPMHRKIAEIAVFLNANYEHDISLEEVARRFYISPSYLSRLFKKITGFQFREYVQVMRVREAQRLLRETKYKIGVIAEKTGYEHAANFNVVFKKITGLTPLQYRKNNTVTLISADRER